MEIISHRGYWKEIAEKNEIISFNRSFELGFGTETDIRDFNGELVIAHDIATKDCITVDAFFKLYKEVCKSNATLALNIKADGLQSILKEKLANYNIENYFVFDMSIPDTLGYLNSNVRSFSRQSEYEKMPFLDSRIQGIWLDSFKNNWFSAETIREHIINGRQVAIVSSELHKRDPIELWTFLKVNNLHEEPNLILCTDLPENATLFFN